MSVSIPVEDIALRELPIAESVLQEKHGSSFYTSREESLILCRSLVVQNLMGEILNNGLMLWIEVICEITTVFTRDFTACKRKPGTVYK